jgi:DNA polymerase (family 10)
MSRAQFRTWLRAAGELGYSYLAITDHSKGLKIAGGINEGQLAKQAEEISAVNDRVNNVRVLVPSS